MLILGKLLGVGQESDGELNGNSMSMDESAASSGRTSVSSAIRDVIAQSLAGRSGPFPNYEIVDMQERNEKNLTDQTDRARSEGARSSPDERDKRRKSMPDKVAKVLARVGTPHFVGN